MINLTTGPVTLLPITKQALLLPEISHRSTEFQSLYTSVTEYLCAKLSVAQTFILTGSGTLANDAMIAQIALRNEHGLILSNGEFGERLVMQADRFELSYTQFKKEHGASFTTEELEERLISGTIKWLLFCHCETSTGVIADLPLIVSLCKKYGCAIYLDCMSSFALYSINLKQVTMATASSGKGAGAIPGLGLIFSNTVIKQSQKVSLCIDLYHAQHCNGIPFTLSSQLLYVLQKSLHINLCDEHYEELDKSAAMIYDRLSPHGIIPFANRKSRVFTIVYAGVDAQKLGEKLRAKGILLSYESNYLKQNNSMQLAIFGYYINDELSTALDIIEAVLHEAKT